MHTNNEYNGLFFGFLAIAAFSITLPATRLAVTHIDPTLVGLGRSLVAAVPAALLLLWFKSPLPSHRQWLGLLIVMAGVVLGFPWLTSLAMQNISGAQGGIIVSVLPLFTAIAGALIIGHRPSAGFWLMAILGSSLVFIYLALDKHGQFSGSELILLGASVLCAIGYAEGGRLAKEMGGFAVISWALVLSVPFSIFPVTLAWSDEISLIPWQAWAGFLYVSLISQWLAFIFWYHGLAIGGVVRVSQIQLLQPFLTLFVASLLLDESISMLMIVFSFAVVISIVIGKRMPVNVIPQ